MNSLSFSKTLAKQAYLPLQARKKHKVPHNNDYQFHEPVYINMGPITTPEYTRPSITITELQQATRVAQPWPTISQTDAHEAMERYRSYIADSMNRAYAQRVIIEAMLDKSIEPVHTPEPHEF